MGVLYARVAGAWVPISGGSSGTDEVAIGTDDPIATNSAAELWYDTDDEPTGGLMGTTTAGNALGVVAVGGTVAMPVNSAAPTAAAGVALTVPVSFTFLTGRRYRLSFAIASVYCSAGTSASVEFRVNDASNVTVGDCAIWFIANGSQITAPLNGGVVETFLDGDGTTKTVRAVICTQSPTSGNTVVVYARPLRIEDVGPTSAPALPIPDTYQSWMPMPFYTTPPSQGGAGNWDVDLSGAYAPQYRKIGDVVSMRGRCLRKNSVAGTGTLTFGLLPVGFRPPTLTTPMFTTARYDNWVSKVFVDSGGGVAFQGGTLAPGLPINDWICLDAITFSVTP